VGRYRSTIRRGGVIGRTYEDSEADWPDPVKAPDGAPNVVPDGAPNVVVIVLDDVGFGQVGTFGGPVSYTDTHAARTAFTFQRMAPGRVDGSGCSAVTKRNQRHRQCAPLGGRKPDVHPCRHTRRKPLPVHGASYRTQARAR
jgi:hypothetical protein